jgi:hypothetical protein
MLCATRILKPPPTTIVKIGGNFNLPRPVAVRSVAAGSAGAIPLMLIGVAIGGFQGLLFGLVIGAAIGVGFTTWEPQKGETLGKLLGVAAQSRMRRKPLELDGETVSVSIGIARISRVAEGYVHILPGAVPVNPDDYDERGVRRSVENRNLVDPSERDADIVAGLGDRSHFPDLDGIDDDPAEVPEPSPAVDDFRIPVPGETPAAPTPAPRRRRRGVPDGDGAQVGTPASLGADEFTIPTPGQPAPAPAKRRRSRRDDTPAPEPGPTWSDDGPVAAPVAAPVEVPAPTAPAVPTPAPVPVVPPTPAAVDDFRIPAPGEPPGPAPAKRRLGRRHRDTSDTPASPAPVPPAPIPAPASVPAPVPPAPVAAAPSPVTPHAPALPHPPSAPHAPTAPHAPGFAGIAPPGAPAKRRKRRKGHDDEPSMLDAWPDPLAGDR